jgi:hypothetical protein
MGVLLQGFYKTPLNNAVPSPADGEGTELFWWDQLATEANSFREAGFTAIWLPPVLKTASGDNKGADGYGPYDDYDIGSRHQKGRRPHASEPESNCSVASPFFVPMAWTCISTWWSTTAAETRRRSFSGIRARMALAISGVSKKILPTLQHG